MYVMKKVHEEVDKADERENTKEQVIDGETNQEEFHPESIEDERVYKVSLLSACDIYKIFVLGFISLLLEY